MRRALTALGGSLADPGLLRLRAAAVTYATALISGTLAAILATQLALGVSLVVLAVMLSISFTADRAGSTASARWSALAVLPVAGVAAAGVAVLLFRMPILGAALFVVVLAGAIWIRRFGPFASRIGTLVSLPLITVLVVPAPAEPGQGFVPWAAAVALVVALIGLGLQWVARATGFVPHAAPVPPAARRPAAGRQEQAATGSAAGSAIPRSGMRPIASTRMAIQMAITLTAAFLIGHLVFGEHWFWAVLTGYLVASGNRGRGDVLFKGIHRTVGAVGGTIVAALLTLSASTLIASGGVDSGTATLIVSAIAVILALGLWLRPAGYGWWAAAMTAMIALVHELDGEPAGPVLLIRLAAIVVAGVVATAVAWWVLPVRTGDALRRRTADALAALTELLLACIRDPDAVATRRADFDSTLAGIEQLGPTLRLERAVRIRSARMRFLRSNKARSDSTQSDSSQSDGSRAENPRRTGEPVAANRADVITALRACWEPVDEVAARVQHGHPLTPTEAKELGALARRLGAYRRMLVGTPLDAPDPESAAFPALAIALGALRPALVPVARPST